MFCRPTCIRARDPHEFSFGGEVWAHLHPGQCSSTVKFVTGVPPEFTKIPQTTNYSSNSDRFLIRMLVPIDFRSNRRQFDANLDEISEEPWSADTKLPAARSPSPVADGAGGTTGASAQAARAGQQFRQGSSMAALAGQVAGVGGAGGAGGGRWAAASRRGSQAEVEEGHDGEKKEIFASPTQRCFFAVCF
jgi:hypothetical protein